MWSDNLSRDTTRARNAITACEDGRLEKDASPPKHSVLLRWRSRLPQEPTLSHWQLPSLSINRRKAGTEAQSLSRQMTGKLCRTARRIPNTFHENGGPSVLYRMPLFDLLSRMHGELPNDGGLPKDGPESIGCQHRCERSRSEENRRRSSPPSACTPLQRFI